jgi:hypothetical protein
MVIDIAADGSRVAVETDLSGAAAPSYNSRIVVWSASGSLSPIPRSACEAYSPIEFVFAGGRAAWLCDNGAAPATYILSVATPGSAGRFSEYVYRGGAMNGGAGADDIGNLAGDGNILVYNTWWSPFNCRTDTWGGPTEQKLWRVLGTKKRLVLAGPDALDAVSVDAGRIAVLRPDGTLVILNEQGKRLSAFRLGRTGIQSEAEAAGRHGEPIRLTGTKLIALRRSTIEVRDAARGTLQHRWPTAAARLEDAQGNFALYTAGVAIHLLRLSDGRDRVLGIADQKGPAHADLEPDGLYYSFNTAHGVKPGHVAFVSFAQLTAQFK